MLVNQHTIWVLLCAALAATASGCSQEKVKVDRTGDIITARTLGLVHLGRDELSEAETQFKTVIALAPREASGYSYLGITYLRSGQYRKAEEQIIRAMAIDSTDASNVVVLAKTYRATNRGGSARTLLERWLRAQPNDPTILYALTDLEAGSADSAAQRRRDAYLQRLARLDPTNLAVRLQLLEGYARRGVTDSAVQQLEEVRRMPPDLPSEAKPYLQEALTLLRASRLGQARIQLKRFHHLMELTPAYQAGLNDMKGPEGALEGRLGLTFSPNLSILERLGKNDTAIRDAIRFEDGTALSGLPLPAPIAESVGILPSGVALAAGDYDGDGVEDLFLSTRLPAHSKTTAQLFRRVGGKFVEAKGNAGIALPDGALSATFADYDNDGRLDLYVVGGDSLGHLLHNTGKGTFRDVTARAGVTGTGHARKAIFFDFDHDGDLDLFLAGGEATLVYRNNLDGTFRDITAGTGITTGARDVAFADFDGDGRIDLFLVDDRGGNALFRNAGSHRFENITVASGLASTSASSAVAIGDFNNDGFLDLFVTGEEPMLYSNKGDGTFVPDRRSTSAFTAVRSIDSRAAVTLDFDNDGWLDLAVARSSNGLVLLRNEGSGKFRNRSHILPPVPVGGVPSLVVSDIDDDGDEDLLIASSQAGVRVVRNDGGNANLYVKVQLTGLRTGSGKNNDFGIGAKIELRAGDLYQTRVATSRVTHFGLGRHVKGDVLRVEWPSGVPQIIYFPGSDQDVLENEILKGSCAFVYTWDGTRYRFVTDVMWRSALGMPLGIMGSNTEYAPAGASQEYLRIPGNLLKPRDGRYTLQLTEELWETAFIDEVKLIAVDHPDSMNFCGDERFVPLTPASLCLYQISRPHLPRSARDDAGADLLPALRAQDDVYASNLTPERYQGVTTPHDLILDLGPLAGADGTYLFLRGWVYPTDASINVALSQQSAVKVVVPTLEVRDARGQWRTVYTDMGFPSGKDKTVIVDLSGKFPTPDHRVRIRTNMQIYWDQAFVGRDAPSSPTRITALAPISADLHYRGFSRMYRKGGRYGPQWFEYDDVTTQQLWRPIAGTLTRFGDVAPLLGNSDDMYVIMGPGDETTMHFDAKALPALPAGWTRDFLLYSDGWIKDSDLNTARGNTVDPLPFHGMTRYPYGPEESYPADAAHQEYRSNYNTRIVRRLAAPKNGPLSSPTPGWQR
ncbi:MAG: FG-GAP-like repeat-containing protein [Gemmatimonadaceae bacterium]